MTPSHPSRRSLLTAGAALAGAAAVPLGGATAAAAAPRGRRHRVVPREWPRPFVVGHRGASAYRPEHTLASWELAARQGAEAIEPDLVSTQDGVLVCRHENEVSGTTDVADHPEFADRRTTKTVDGVVTTGWFTEDFTLAELKTLRAVERLPDLRPNSTVFDGAWEVPTFAEALRLRARLSRELGRTIGIVPEVKHPTYFRGLGLDTAAAAVRALRGAGLDSPGSGAAVQSFEPTTLVRLRRELRWRAATVFLTSAAGAPWDLASSGDPRSYADLLRPAALRELARDVDVLGPENRQVVALEADGSLGAPTSLVADAHAAGMLVVPYTVRPENSFLPADLRTGTDPARWGRSLDFAQALFAAGVDGAFFDAPDLGVLARERFLA